MRFAAVGLFPSELRVELIFFRTLRMLEFSKKGGKKEKKRGKRLEHVMLTFWVLRTNHIRKANSSTIIYTPEY